MQVDGSDQVTYEDIVAFYDNATTDWLREFVARNPRVEAAIELVGSCVTPETRNILDVGCGIGVSTARLNSQFRHVLAHGVDISPRAIEIANRMFRSDSTVFSQGDMTCVPAYAPYDILSLIDVYEHVPRFKWPNFNHILSQSLSSHGTLVLTAPTPLTQAWYAAHCPEALQVVDETIECRDVLQLAEDIGGVLTMYRIESIGRSNDYFHAVIERVPQLATLPAPRGMVRRVAALVSRKLQTLGERRRRNLVLSRLGVRV